MVNGRFGVKEKRADKQVARELQAKTMLDAMQVWIASPRKLERDQVKPGLASLQANFGDTEAGEQSKKVQVTGKVDWVFYILYPFLLVVQNTSTGPATSPTTKDINHVSAEPEL